MTVDTNSLHAKRNLWTLANMLSISRVLLTIPIVYLLLQDGDTARWWAFALIAVAIVTDSLDGMAARKRNEITEEGKVLDPLADKIAVGAIGFVLAITGELPIWFVAIILGRDLLIIIAGGYLKSRYDIVLSSNRWGKWAVTVIAFTIFFILLPIEGLEYVESVMIGLSVFFLIASTLSYAIRFFKIPKVVRSE